jgi:hypothetical protein
MWVFLTMVTILEKHTVDVKYVEVSSRVGIVLLDDSRNVIVYYEEIK